MSFSVQDYIVVVENVISDDLCDAIISEYKHAPEWRQSLALNADNNLDHSSKNRNCSEIDISNHLVIESNKYVRSRIDQDVFQCVSNATNKYIEKFNNLLITKDSGYMLLKYSDGCFYKQHTDSGFDLSHRQLSCSLALNDDFDGGEFAFFDDKIRYRLAKGSAIMFPSNFMYPHQITPVSNGERYSIVTWLYDDRTSALEGLG